MSYNFTRNVKTTEKDVTNIHIPKLIKILNLCPSHFWLSAVCLKNLSLHRITLY